MELFQTHFYYLSVCNKKYFSHGLYFLHDFNTSIVYGDNDYVNKNMTTGLAIKKSERRRIEEERGTSLE